MAALEYSFAAVNANVINVALASIERRVAVHNARVNRMLGTPVGRPRSGPHAISQVSADQRKLRQIIVTEQRSMHRERMGQIKAEQRAAAQAARAEAQALRERQRLIDRTSRSQQSLARQRASEERGAARAAAAVGRERRRVAGGLFGTAGRSVAGSLAGVGRFAGAALGIGGSFALASAAQAQMSETAKASQLANSAGRPEIKGQLLRQAQGVQGFTGMEALEGLESFVTKTGDLEAARKLLPELSQLALATGANLGDLGQTAGQAFNAMKDQIKDPAELLKQVGELMPVLAQQGRMGAVEIKDLATEFGKLGAASRAFEGTAPNLLRSMGAFAQIALEKGGAASSSDAATAAARLPSDIVTNRKKFAALGVGIQSKTDKTKLRAPEEIMLDVLEKTKGDVTKTSGLFGMESRKIFQGIAATYSEAEKREKGSGRGAAMAEFQRFAGAEASAGEIASQAKSRLSDPDLQLKEATKQFNAAVGSQLLPVITRLVPVFAGMIPTLAKAAELLGKFVEEVANNPLASIGKIIAAKVAFDLASAGIGAAVKGQIVSSLQQAGLGAGASGAISAALSGLSIGTLTAAAIYTEGITSFESGEADAKNTGEKLNMMRALGKSTDPITEDQLKTSREAVKGQRAKVDKMFFENSQFTPSNIWDGAKDLFGASNRGTEISTQSQMLVDMEAQLAGLEAAAEAQNRAAAATERAAAATESAAASLAGSGARPNSGNTPSPVK